MEGWELRDRRRRAGLTFAQVARAAGTAQSNVSAYELGRKKPGERALARVLAAIEAGQTGAVHRQSLLTAPAAAAALRAGLRAGWFTADLLRLLRQLKSDERAITAESDRASFYAEPSTTGDPRWDAALAGVVEELALAGGVPVPEWTRGTALPSFWFVGDAAPLRAYCFAHTPFSLLVRGVLLDPTDLEAV